LKEAYPTYTNIELRKKLDDSAIDVGTPGKDIYTGYGLVQAPLEAQPEVPRLFTIFESEYLYQAPHASMKTFYGLAPQSLNYVNSVGGWYKVKTWIGDMWVKPKYFMEGQPQQGNGSLMINKKIPLYNVPNANTSPVTTITPQTVNYVEKYFGWYHIKTWMGLKWIFIDYPAEITPIGEQLKVNNQIRLYESATSYVTKVDITPQTLTAFEKWNDWYHIYTWLGPKWVYGPALVFGKDIIKQNQIVHLTKITAFYAQPNSWLPAYSSLGPQNVNSYERWNDWYHINTWVGPMWIKP
jgi:hypothetical protein